MIRWKILKQKFELLELVGRVILVSCSERKGLGQDFFLRFPNEILDR